MEIKQFIRHLKNMDIDLVLKGSDLEINFVGEDLPESLIDEIKLNKQEIVALLKQIYFEKDVIIDKAPIMDSYPLSSSQLRLWFLSQSNHGNIAYNIQGAYEFEGELNIECLEQAFDTLIARHEILRTVFREDAAGELRQFIFLPESIDFTIRQYDLRLESDTKNRLKEIIQGDVEKPFDLTVCPLLRIGLVRTENEKYILSFVMHHIISDGWSMQVMINEILTLYNAFIDHKKDPLVPLKIQYKDYAVWQQNQLTGEKLNVYKEFWENQFADELPILEMPTDKVRPAVQTFNGESTDAKYLNAIDVRELKNLVKAHESTLFMGLVSVIKTLLYHYTSQKDIIIGTPIAGRVHEDLEEQIGFYVNTLALRSKFIDTDTFLDLLDNIKKTTLQAYEHQIYPFDMIVDDNALKRDISRNPLFDVMVLLEIKDVSRANAFDEALNDIIVSGHEGGKTISSKFDLLFVFKELDDQLSISIEYNSDIYIKESMQLLLERFEKLLNAVVTNPLMPINELELINETERSQILNNFNNTNSAVPKKTIVELFEEQTLLTPDKISVSDTEHSLTYMELNKLSNKLGRFLNEGLQIKPESKIGILQERNVNAIVSILGVLKAGCAYVPLDSEYPEERLLFMLDDSNVEVLLVNKNLIEFANKLQWRCNKLKTLVCIDSDNFYLEKGLNRNELMRKELWDYVGDTATDAISGGGWKNSYTGEDLSEKDMSEYSENVYLKLEKYLNPEMKVLEIGCSSGLTMSQIAPKVGKYYGTDLSSSILEGTAKMIEEKQYSNVILTCLPAHDIDQLDETEFDLVIINSVIQCFDGHNYLRNVLVNAIKKLKKNGLIFLGDLMDEDKRNDLVSDLTSFKKLNFDKGYRTKTDWSSELFISRDFLFDFGQDNTEIASIEYSDKYFTLVNELTKYRFDAILYVDKQKKTQGLNKIKSQFDLGLIDKIDDSDLNLHFKNNNLAYVMYTSGSTGVPKGAMIEHKSIVRLVKNTNYINLNDQDILLSTGSLSFDATTFEFWGMLLNGGHLIMCSRNVLLDNSELVNTINGNGVNTMWFTAGWANQLIDEKIEVFQNLKTIIIGGDKLSPLHINLLVENYPNAKIINGYGPTENTTFSLTYHIDSQLKSIPIGKPISNSNAYILNTNGNLLPIGIAGEIYVGGDGLARGYLNNDELTLEKFVSSPFKKGEKLYRTGDIGKWLASGDIEFLGRKDDQVKIRGYRVELGEIEIALQSYEKINSVVVLIKPNENSEKSLIAYVVGAEDLNTIELRSYLKTMLPDYMIPEHYVQLQSFPLTKNGKVDRAALPGPSGSGMLSGIVYVAPKDELENKLVTIWSSVLGIEKDRIGVNDNFFDLGGNSIKIMKMVGLINKECQQKISVVKAFSFPNISSLSEHLRNDNKETNVSKEDFVEAIDVLDNTLNIINDSNDGK